MTYLELPMHWLSLYGRTTRRFTGIIPYELADEVDLLFKPEYAAILQDGQIRIDSKRMFDPALMAERVVVWAVFDSEHEAALFKLTHL
jgi:hypothetical protein